MKSSMKFAKTDYVFAALLALWKNGLEDLVAMLVGPELALYEQLFTVVLASIAAVRVYLAAKRGENEKDRE